ncbi:hypothetical protein Mapa_013530 [Marchantia paleacea]|nr:hypothetical protein Mapa_013530 [Marchantia paleacea]
MSAYRHIMQVGNIAAVKPGTFGRWSQNLQGMGLLVILSPKLSSNEAEAACRVEASITTDEYKITIKRKTAYVLYVYARGFYGPNDPKGVNAATSSWPAGCSLG